MPPLEWKTTRVGNATVTHWAKHDASELVRALETTPEETHGRWPKVYVHKFGRMRVAVRKMSRPDISRMDLIKKTVDRCCAIIELPIALVETESREAILAVTRWKEGTHTLTERVCDPTVPFEEKRGLCKKAMAVVARLNAAGFQHMHPHASNFIVHPNNRVSLVDYTRLEKINPHYLDFDGLIATKDLGNLLAERMPLGDYPPQPKGGIMARTQPQLKSELKDDIERELNEAYYASFEKWRKRY